jgi:hypothetical protein
MGIYRVTEITETPGYKHSVVTEVVPGMWALGPWLLDLELLKAVAPGV